MLLPRFAGSGKGRWLRREKRAGRRTVEGTEEWVALISSDISKPCFLLLDHLRGVLDNAGGQTDMES